jgi:Zn-dependent protease
VKEADAMNPITVVGSAVLVILAITTHEACHGFVADRLGDPTAREQGRLTLNPLPHIDLFFTILLPLFLILSGTGIILGGAKPVPVVVSRLRNPRRDWALVGAAGPASNLAMAVGLAVLLAIVSALGLATPGFALAEVLAIGIFVNVLLAVFNLIPIPPLDGSRVAQYFLSGGTLEAYRGLERYGLLVIVGLVFFFPPARVFLREAVVVCTAAITWPLGVWPDMEPILRRALFG